MQLGKVHVWFRSKCSFHSIETVPPLKDEPTTAMPAEALDTSTNPPLEQEDAPVEQEDAPVEQDDAQVEQEDAPVEQDDAPVEQEDGRIDASELVNNEDGN